MTYKVAIRKNATGEVRVREYAYDWFKDAARSEESSDMFWWTEGNFGCDCNRYLEFERAGGNEPDMNDESRGQCGMEAYSVLYADLPDGTRIKIDTDEASETPSQFSEKEK